MGEKVVVIRPGPWELDVHDPDGGLERRIRSAVPRLPVTRDLRDAARAGLEEWYPANPQFAGLLDRVELPDSASAISQVVVSEDENAVWVLRWRLWAPPRGFYSHRLYDLIDEDGRWRRMVRVPESAGEVRAVRGNRVLTVYHDELGIPYVRVYLLDAGPLQEPS